jgi:2-polyprenyl-6-methoxyphenol hydroxylase-like FAD-dependent oxidoreductase
VATSAPTDVVVGGGGFAGSALAVVLARRGLRVTVLERQTVHVDRVRGEYLHPWGVAEARRLDLCDLLLRAGGLFVTRAIRYDETQPAHAAEAAARDLGAILPDIAGGLCVGHPAACRALGEAAEAAGARFVRGARAIDVASGPRPAVAFAVGGVTRRLSCRLVVGADGRSSTVRSQAGIRLERAEAAHLFSGMLVGGAPHWPQDTHASGTEVDWQCQVFPQGDGRLRLYTGTALDQRHRYAGPGGPARFLDDFRRMACMPLAESLASAVQIGACATFGAEDTWVDLPLGAGVVLLGDAAGYNDPIIGQGLSLALRDTRVLVELLLGEREWSCGQLMPYADERRERLRRVRLTAALMAEIFATFGPSATARRARVISRLREPNSSVRALMAGLATGPESVSEWPFTEEFRADVLR